MTWAMLSLLTGVLMLMNADILYALKDKAAADRNRGTALVFFAMALAIAKGWI